MKKRLFLAGLAAGLLMFGSLVHAEDEAIYDPSTGVLYIPTINIGVDYLHTGSTYYGVEMQQEGSGLDFRVSRIFARYLSSYSSPNLAAYNQGYIHIPTVIVGTDSYMVNMQLQEQGLNFTVTGAAVVPNNLPTSPDNSPAGQAVIDLGSYGKLIAPVQVNGHWYYFWDRSGDGTSYNAGSLNNGIDYCSHYTLDSIFTQDIHGIQNPGTGTTNTFRYATLNGIRVALPTIGDGSILLPQSTYHLADNQNYTDLAAIWDTYYSDYQTETRPPDWPTDYFFLGDRVGYWVATQSPSLNPAAIHLSTGYVEEEGRQEVHLVVLEVL